MLFAGSGSLAQRVRPTRDGFTAVDLILAAEAPGLPGDVELQVLDPSTKQPVRSAHMPAAALPTAAIWDLRPGSPGERWQSLGFEPIQESAGRDYVVLVRYPPPNGVDTPGRRVATLAHFPNTYQQGSLAVNTFPAGGELLVRLGAAGTHGDALLTARDNLARRQPVWTGTVVAPAVAGALSVWFAVALAIHLARLR